MTDLFGAPDPVGQPLAAALRPQSLDQVVGQHHLLGPTGPLTQLLAKGHLPSLILWGPPGVGKTTLARLLCDQVDAQMLTLSAVTSGVKDIRAVVEQAKQGQAMGRRTVLFVDEVHRFNKSQQDAFLPWVEEGVLTLIGATTENPAFELNAALLSRARVMPLKSLVAAELNTLLDRALATQDVRIDDAARGALIAVADGDARRCLGLAESAMDLAVEGGIDLATLEPLLSGSVRRFDKGGDVFYDQVSALHKSIRGSSPDGAVYWLARLIDAGCDPLYLARRFVRMASEDIGNAEPRALQIAMDAYQATERLGLPECDMALAQAAIFLASVPKSNAVYVAYNAAKARVEAGGSDEVPNHLRNAPTKLARDMGHGAEYRYAHDEPDGYAAGVNYLPDGVQDRFYQPVPRGLEIKIGERLARLQARDKQQP
ncbi:AAA family ATPase [Litorivicinus lipolyticus]|uniref:Replication-associated recombination protein A n=1 Tax=Litorivicinus lipolyticus TaxID=418701 RepID=A0A5Q2QDF9_9GAMM|nr:replication-associated recombination protein A [Litorivicinus lipolyticus]QGG79890.1 AAA family ATPase [Litorivicinus lipolyticus]